MVISEFGDWAWGVGTFDATSLFVAIIIALLTGEIYSFFLKKGYTIKMPDSVPPAVANSFTALIPGAVIVFLALLVNVGLALTSFHSLKNLIITTLQAPLVYVGTSYLGTMFVEFFAHLMWSFGLHGHNIKYAIMMPIMQAAALENLEAYRAGAAALPHIVTMDFPAFVYIGGAGTTLPLAVWMTFFAKSRQLKQIGRLAIVPGIFNINEPIIFGLPIVLNPMMLIPFFLAPLACVTTAYAGIASGLFPRLTGIQIPWTAPKLITAYLGTGGDWRGPLLVVINFCIAALIYYPFIKAWDRQKVKEESQEA